MEKQERMQRVRVGLTGLAAVLIVVAAAAAIFESASDDDPFGSDASNTAATATAIENMLPPEKETPNEPLAEIGAAPASGPTGAEKKAEEPKQGASGS